MPFIFKARGTKLLLTAILLGGQHNLMALAQAPAAESIQPPVDVVKENDPVNLKGIISLYDGPAPEQLVGNLASAALQRDTTHESLLKKDKQMKGVVQKALSGARTSLQFMAEYRGFEMSSEAADIILDEKLRLKSKSSTEYACQRKADEVHARIFASMLQLAQGLGTTDPGAREKIIASGMVPLKEMVGEQMANSALSSLKSWSNQITVPEAVFNQTPWTVMELQQKTEDLLRESAQGDPLMGLVRRALHKYNGHSKLSLGAAKVINTSLSLAMLTPSLVAPAASILQYVYQMSTGGPEDQKLLTELYFDRRLDCRWRRLNKEATQSIDAYNNAILTRNKVLLALSESFISALGGEEAGSRIIGEHKLVARQSTHSDAIDCVQTHSSM